MQRTQDSSGSSGARQDRQSFVGYGRLGSNTNMGDDMSNTATTATAGNVLKNAYVARRLVWANCQMILSHRRLGNSHDYNVALKILRYADAHNIGNIAAKAEAFRKMEVTT
jgi:hypothetical protein